MYVEAEQELCYLDLDCNELSRNVDDSIEDSIWICKHSLDLVRMNFNQEK